MTELGSVQGISISAGNNVNNVGTQFKAEDGVAIQADGIVNVDAALSTSSSSSSSDSSSFFGIISSESQNNTNTQKYTSSLIDANNIAINGKTVAFTGTDLNAESVSLTYDTLILNTTKNTTNSSNFSDGSGILVRTIDTGGSISEEAVLSRIDAQQITLNGTQLLGDSLTSDMLLEDIKAANPSLNTDQLVTIQATLQNDAWQEQTKTLSKMGSVLVQAAVGYFTAGAGSGLIEVGNRAAQAMIDQAVSSVIKQVATEVATAAITGNALNLNTNTLFENALQSAALVGITQRIDTQYGFNELDPLTGQTLPLSLAQQTQQTLLHSIAQSAVTGADLETLLVTNLATAGAKTAAGSIGDNQEALGTLGYNSAHALLGCGLAQANGGSCEAGALGAVVGENLAISLGQLDAADQLGDKEILLLSQVGSALIAGTITGDPEAVMLATTNAVTNNYLNHQESKTRDQLRETLEQCNDSANSCTSSEISELEDLVQQLDQRDKELDRALIAACGFGSEGSSACSIQSTFALQAMLNWEQAFAGQEGISDQEKQTIYQNWVDAGRPKDSGTGEFFTNVGVISKAAAYNKSLQDPNNAKLIDVLDRAAVLDIVGAGVRLVGGSEEAADAAGLVTAGAGLVVAGRLLLKKLSKTSLVDVGEVPEDIVPPKTARDEFTGPYDSNTARADLEATHGADNVTSTTNPNNPLQTVNSNPNKGVEVITDSYGNKAVRVKFDDPVTGVPTSANIPYNNRGLPVFDDHAKYTTNIDKTKSYDAQFSQATRDLRDGINSGKVDSSQFTANQLSDIKSGSKKIEDFTWHHNADSGNMQLIPTDVHKAVKHVGDKALSGGK
ncbi:MAG: hypothetical protein ACI9S7_002001 [Candidatus Paceibacteria bacterium]